MRCHEGEELKDKKKKRDIIQSLKLELPEFDGDLDPKVVIEWMARCDRIFEVKEYDDEECFMASVIKLKGYASLWWENFKKQRTKMGKSKV